MVLGLAEQIAVVTGAGGGLSAAVVRLLATEGASPVLAVGEAGGFVRLAGEPGNRHRAKLVTVDGGSTRALA